MEIKTTFNVGDRVKITGANAPSDKVGKKGIIRTIVVNGAFVKLDNGIFTSVKFTNLEKIYNNGKIK